MLLQTSVSLQCIETTKKSSRSNIPATAVSRPHAHTPAYFIAFYENKSVSMESSTNETKTPWKKKIRILFRALFVRLLFMLHTLTCTWQVVDMKRDDGDYNLYWFLLLTQVLLVCETVVTLTLRKNGEWDWFSPCMFLYLVGVVPCIWLLELELLAERQAVMITNSGMMGNNVTCGFGKNNMTESLFGFGTSIRIETNVLNAWRSSALQQSFLILIIIGRWLLPRGTLRHHELSNLLLVHIGMAADILEFIIDNLEVDEIRCDKTFIIVILAIWTWSLMQFPFHSFSKEIDEIAVDLEPEKRIGKKKKTWFMRCVRSPDVWGSICTCVMQDGPFLLARIYCSVRYGLAHQSQVFFMAKNILVLLLQFYRLWALLNTWEDAKGKVLERKLKSLRKRLTVRKSNRNFVVTMANSRSGRTLERDNTFKTFDSFLGSFGSSTNHVRSRNLEVPEIVIDETL
ncbi:transmembrane protein 26-like [Amphiura filiformis]|uniref:transmembrane protein 26-like n=1 Tax=Amphiura filiformis TaxID=82378 RepID=UPI003B21D771